MASCCARRQCPWPVERWMDGRPASMTGQGRGDQHPRDAFSPSDIHGPRDTTHSKVWERILRSGGPESANPVSGPQVSSRPNEKGVGGRHGETVLEFSCPNRLGTRLSGFGEGDESSTSNPSFLLTQRRGGAAEEATPPPHLPPRPGRLEGYGQGSRMQDDVSCMTTICVTASTTGHRRRASSVSFRCWMFATAQGRRPRHLVKIQVVSRPNCSLVPAGPSFPSSSPIPYIIPSDPLLPLGPRSALFPTFTCLFSPTQQRTALSLFDYRPVGQPHRHKSTVDKLRPLDTRVQTPTKESSSVRLRNHACLYLPRGAPLFGEHFGAPKASDEHAGREGGTFRPSSDGKLSPFPVMRSVSLFSFVALSYTRNVSSYPLSRRQQLEHSTWHPSFPGNDLHQ